VIPSTATSTSSLPTELQQFIKTEATFQLAIRVNLAQLLVPAFLNDYIRNGKLDLVLRTLRSHPTNARLLPEADDSLAWLAQAVSSRSASIRVAQGTSLRSTVEVSRSPRTCPTARHPT